MRSAPRRGKPRQARQDNYCAVAPLHRVILSYGSYMPLARLLARKLSQFPSAPLSTKRARIASPLEAFLGMLKATEASAQMALPLSPTSERGQGGCFRIRCAIPARGDDNYPRDTHALCAALRFIPRCEIQFANSVALHNAT